MEKEPLNCSHRHKSKTLWTCLDRTSVQKRAAIQISNHEKKMATQSFSVTGDGQTKQRKYRKKKLVRQ